MSMFLTALLASVLSGDGTPIDRPAPSPWEARTPQHGDELQRGHHARQAANTRRDDALFAIGEPGPYRQLLETLPTSQSQAQTQLLELLAHTRDILAGVGADVVVTGRVKTLRSTHQKMLQKGIPARSIRDRTALRIIVPSVQDCYRVMHTLRQHHACLAHTVKDYIEQPKPNGYQSLQASFVTETEAVGRGVVEFQIRTPSMHQHAERGDAAHWRYKRASALGFPSPVDDAEPTKPVVFQAHQDAWASTQAEPSNPRWSA
jgi:GTP pyrophosphokinase